MPQDDRSLPIRRSLLRHAALSPKALEVLSDLYLGESLRGTEVDDPIRIDPNIGIAIEQGAQLHQLVRANRAKRSLEIGFAYGLSTTWLLDALSAEEGASHIAIDPHQRWLWKGVGLHQVGRLDGIGPSFTHLEEWSMTALGRLIEQRRKFDFIFVDGNHRFDDILVDFYLCDYLLEPGGLMAFDDMWMQSMRAVASFIEKNRQYRIVDQPVEDLRVFRKLSDDGRPWDHYRSFRTSFPPKGPDRRLGNRIRNSAPYMILRARAGRLWRSVFPRRRTAADGSIDSPLRKKGRR
jgi:predicted O-methyltransferase YrrM